MSRAFPRTRGARILMAAVVLVVALGGLGVGLFILLADEGEQRELSETVNSDGGSFRVKGLTLVVPSGAVSTETAVTMEALADAEAMPGLEGTKPLSNAFRVEIAGELLRPVTVEIEYDPELIPTDDVTPFLTRYDDAAEEWVMAQAQVDEKEHVVRAETDELSIWQVDSWWLDAFKTALHATLTANPLEYWEAVDSYLGCLDGAQEVLIDDSTANSIIDGCVEADEPNRPIVRVINRKVFPIEFAPVGENAERAQFESVVVPPNGQRSTRLRLDGLYLDDSIEIQGRLSETAFRVWVVRTALLAVPFGEFVPFDQVVEVATEVDENRAVRSALAAWGEQEYARSTELVGEAFSDAEFADLLLEKLGDSILHFVGRAFVSALLSDVVRVLVIPQATIEIVDIASTAGSPQGPTGTISFYSNRARPTPTPTPAPLPGPEEGHPVALEDYAELIQSLQLALENGDAALLQQLFQVAGRAELWIGDWGYCGAGVRVAPMDQENVNAILSGSRIVPVAIGKRDACSQYPNPTYGVITTGWSGKILPHTYSGDDVSPSEFSAWEFAEDTVMLVFWSEFTAPAQPSFFGLAPSGPFTQVSDLPSR